MAVSQAQFAVYASLRRAGATAAEAAIVLSIAEGIVAAIELAGSRAWEHEPRGPDGKWVSTGGTVRDIAKAAGGSSYGHVHGTGRAHVTRRQAATPAELEGRYSRIHQQIKAKAVADATSQAQVLDAREATDFDKIISKVKEDGEKVRAAAEHAEARAVRVKFLSHMGFAIAGAILALLEAKFGFIDAFGIPGAIPALTALAPSAGLEAIDMVKKL